MTLCSKFIGKQLLQDIRTERQTPHLYRTEDLILGLERVDGDGDILGETSHGIISPRTGQEL